MRPTRVEKGPEQGSPWHKPRRPAGIRVMKYSLICSEIVANVAVSAIDPGRRLSELLTEGCDGARWVGQQAANSSEIGQLSTQQQKIRKQERVNKLG